MPLTSGTQIGPYKIVGWIGAGGMGEVYRASDPRLARDVAIKLIPETLAADPTRLRRFEQEARAAGQLNHPNILAVYDIGDHAGSPYIVSELLEGESLRTRLQRGVLPSRKAIDCARQIAEGLSAAHAKGIVHRDLKPDNLFLTNDGRVKILDFGIAKLARQGDDSSAPTAFATETAEGLIIGTVGYMSPEQVRGETVDQRSDLFNFGAILYEMLTGRQAFIRATAPETMAAVLKEDPVEAFGPAGSPALTRIVSRCLEKTREARFQSARDLGFALEVLTATGEAAATAAPGAPRRHWPLAVGAGVVAIALVAGVASWLMRDVAPPLENLLANATFTPLTDFPGSEEDAAISPDGKFIVFLADRHGGPFHIWLSQIGSGQFDDLTPGAGDQRNPGLNRSVGFTGDGSEVWLSGGASGGNRLRLLPLLGGTPRAFLEEHAVNVAWSHDGKRLVSFTFDPGDPLSVADASGGNPRQIWIDPNGEHNHFPAWSVDDQWIYFAKGNQASTEYDVWRIRPSGGAPERLTQHNRYVRYVTPIDARTILYVSPDEDNLGPWLWALDVERKTTRRVSIGLEQYQSVSANAGGRRLVASVANQTASLWTVPILPDRQADEREVKAYDLPSTRALAPRIAKTSLFYLSSIGARDGLFRFQDGKPVQMWKGSDGVLTSPPAVSPQGDRVAVASSQQGKRRLNIIAADGSGNRSLSADVDVRGAAAWSRDAKWIVTGGNDADGPGLFLVPVDGGAPLKILKSQAYDPVWSPTEDLILYSGHQTAGAPLLAIRPDGSPVTTLPPIRVPFGGGGRVRFLPNGTGVVYVQGPVGQQDFWLLDFATMKPRRLTQLSSTAKMYTFDITADGRQILFDRLQDNSNLRLIDLAK